MAAEVSVCFRDDRCDVDDEENYEDWLRGTLEAIDGITVLTVEVEEV